MDTQKRIRIYFTGVGGQGLPSGPYGPLRRL